VDPRTGLDNLERREFLTLPGLELLPPCRPARRQTVYRLRYPPVTGIALPLAFDAYRNKSGAFSQFRVIISRNIRLVE
jgi:hypothetical protein